MATHSVINLVNGVLTFMPLSVAPQMGRVCVVDGMNGNDATGARGGLPFLTPAAAIAAAIAGDVVFVLPGIYALAAGLVLPDGVSLTGLNHAACALQMAGVTADTVLLTLGEGCLVEDVSLVLQSAGHYSLTGVLFPGTTAATSSIEDVFLTVDNSGASDGGTSNVYGVHSTGNGSNEDRDAVKDGSITVRSAGVGSKRGVLVDTATAFFSCRNVVVDAYRTGSGSGTYVGLETNFAGCTLFFRIGTVDGFSSDILQTLGTLRLGNTSFLNHTAGGLGFSIDVNPPQMDWGDNGAVASGTSYLYRGTATASASVVPKTRISQAACAVNLVVRAAVGPGASRTDTWTLQVDGVDTALTVSLVGAATSVTSTVSVTCPAGSDISVKMVCEVGSTTSNVQVTCEFV